MKTKIVLAVTLAIFGSATAQDTLKYTLNDLYQLTEINSRAVKIENYNLTASDYAIQRAKFNRLPELSGHASADYATNMPIYDKGIFHTPSQHEVIHFLYNTGADFYLNLYQGSLNELQIKEQTIRKNLSQIQLEQTTAQVKLETTFAFLDLYRSYIFHRVILEDIEDQKQQLREIKELYNSGVVLHSDVLRIELELSKREYLLVEITNDIKRLSQRIALLAGLDETKVIFPILEQLQPKIQNFEENFHIAHHSAFALRKSSLMVELSALDVKKQRAAYIPHLSLQGSFTFANPQIFLYPYNASWYTLGIVGLKLNVPISNWYTNKPMMAKAKIEELKEEEQHHHEADALKNQLLNANLQYDESIIKTSICEKNILLAEENLRIIKDNYFQSTALITDLLDANMSYLKSIFELETAKINQLHFYYQIEYIKGSL